MAKRLKNILFRLIGEKILCSSYIYADIGVYSRSERKAFMVNRPPCLYLSVNLFVSLSGNYYSRLNTVGLLSDICYRVQSIMYFL